MVEQNSKLAEYSTSQKLTVGEKIVLWLHRLNFGRYEDIVPEEMRELAEANDLPKPTRYMP